MTRPDAVSAVLTCFRLLPQIKHGRLSMAATLGVIVTEAGLRFPGALSPSNGLDFSDVPGSLEGAYDTVPLAGWAQIVCLVAALDIAAFRQVHCSPPAPRPDRCSFWRVCLAWAARVPFSHTVVHCGRTRRTTRAIACRTWRSSGCATATLRSRLSSSTLSATTAALPCLASSA